jgi:hypothetical protein
MNASPRPQAATGSGSGVAVDASTAALLSELSGILVRPTEIAALRLNPRKGVEGNEVLFRSGVTVTLSYELARKLAETLRDDRESCRCSALGKSGTSDGEALVYVAGK